MDIKDWAALFGAITGPLGILIGSLVYFRDRAKVQVDLQWDMAGFGSAAESSKTFFVVTIRNVGRRPIYLSHAHMKLPADAGVDGSHLLLTSGIEGVTLAEGAAPHMIHADQTGMKKYEPIWWRLRATVIDSGGKHYHSDWPTKPPSWANDKSPPRSSLVLNHFRNWLRRRLL